MSTTSVFDWSTTAGSNTDVAGNGISGSDNLSLGNDVFQNIMAQVAAGLIGRGSDIATASTLSFTGASTRALTHDLTGTTTVTAVALTAGHWRICRAQGAFQLTASSTLVVNGSTSTNYTTTAGDLLVFFGYSSSTVRVWAFSGGGASFAANSDALGATSTAKSLTPANLAQERTLGAQNVNVGLSASVNASALTVSLTGIDGSTPSATDPVTILFRNATVATGTPVSRLVTGSTSVTVASTKTLGTSSSNVPFRIWVVAVDTGSGIELGLVNALSGTSIMALRPGIYSPTATPGNSAQVIYTTSGQTSKPIVILGWMEWASGLATAGTWASGPTTIKLWQPGDPLPGDVVQVARNATGTVATGSTAIPLDNTIPQITEGDQYMSQAITPFAASDILRVTTSHEFTNASNIQLVIALFRDSGSNAVASIASGGSQGQPLTSALGYAVQAGSASATTFKLRAGGASGTTTFNGQGGSGLLGGVMASFIQVEEIMA
jgi:hypothetical protein